MENTLDEEKSLQAFLAFFLNMLINYYAVERVAFGYEKPGDKAPIDLYLEHLFLGFNYEPHMRKNIPGVYIDEQEHINAQYDYNEYVHDLYIYSMENLFYDAPKDVYLERDGEELPLVLDFRDFLLKIEPLFAELLSTEVEYNAYDLIPTDKAERIKEYRKWKKFVTAILIKPLKSGSRINRYVKDINNAPFYIRRLIERKGKNYYLKLVDIDSYEYIFALFSLINFKNAENEKLLELKMFEWERRHKPE